MDPPASTITPSDLECMLFDEDAEPKALTFTLLEQITKGFSPEMKIDEGGFAVVYKGVLEHGIVAVKRLTEESMDEKEYGRELECLMKVNHINIVRFLGYCGDTQWDMRTTNKGKLIKSNKEKRLLCFEYVPHGSLRNYIKDPSEGLGWRKRYQIIKGICEGLHYLHDIRIVHLDLKPGNILLGKNMVPKITDFGLSRCFKEGKADVTATKEVGTMGYMAPEYNSKKINYKFDLYSLGVIIIEIMTGHKGHQAVDNVLESWSSRLDISKGNVQWEQIRVCAEIGMQCIDSDPDKRPDNMKHIRDMLAATESVQVIPAAGGQSELLGVHPFALCFPFEPAKTSACSLHLTNNTDEHLAFRLMDKSRESTYCFVRVPLYGVVPPRSPYTLVVITKDKNLLQEKINIDLVLESTRLWEGQDSDTFHSQPDNIFEKAKEMQNVIQEVSLKAVYNPRRRMITATKQVSPTIKILSKDITYESPYSLDANQAKQWIVIGEDYGHIRIWNYRTQTKVDSLKVSSERVTCVKFIARNQWLVAGTANGFVHVYNCETQLQNITSFRAADKYVTSLAIHPTQPYLLLAYDREIKLIDWNKGWECIRTFDNEHKNTICQVAFNAVDTFASASEDHTMKVWSLDSPKSGYTFYGHSNKVNCLNFFTCDDQDYLVTGSDDCTAKIWDMQNKICVDTIESSASPVMSVLYQPCLHILITGSRDGSVNFWSATNSCINSRSYRLERIINIGCRGAVHGMTCLNRSVVIGKEDAVAMLDINNVNDPEESNNCMETHLNEDSRQGDSTSKVTTGSSIKLLHVYPRELDLPFLAYDPEPCCLELTNNTDEYVAFRLIDKNPSASCHYEKAHLYGIVPPRLTYSLFVKLLGRKELGYTPDTNGIDLNPAIESSILGDKYTVPFKDQFECDDFFWEAKEMGNVVHHLTLQGVRKVQPMSQPEKMKITRTEGPTLLCIDAHPTEQWILSGHGTGVVKKWIYNDLKSIRCQADEIVGQQTRISTLTANVNCVKVIPRQNRIVAGTGDGILHVYNCERVGQMKKITSSRDFDSHCYLGSSLDLHPTQPYVLSSSLKIWFSEKKDTKTSLKVTQIFRHVDSIRQAIFNPEEANSFATVLHNHNTVQVWNLDSPEPNYTLSGHSAKVNCLAFFRRFGQQYLITGSDDGTAKIWDLQIKSCIHTLESFISSVTCVSSLPGRRPYLVAGSANGSIRVWRTTDFRLQRIIYYGRGGPVRGIVCLMASRRVVIGQENAISIMDIDENNAYTSNGISNIDTEEEEAVAGLDANNETIGSCTYIIWLLAGILYGICEVSGLSGICDPS